jgi:hypothetical protein
MAQVWLIFSWKAAQHWPALPFKGPSAQQYQLNHHQQQQQQQQDQIAVCTASKQQQHQGAGGTHCGLGPVLALLIVGLIMMWGHQLRDSAWMGLVRGLLVLVVLQESQHLPVALLHVGGGMIMLLLV